MIGQKSAEEVHNLIRGLSPYPAAYTLIDGKQLKVFISSFEKKNGSTHQPGYYETDGKSFLRFAVADGWVNCLEVQYEGKKKMPVADFLRGFRVK